MVHQLPGNTLDIEVYDEDQSSKDDFLGRTALSIPDLAEKAVSDMVGGRNRLEGANIGNTSRVIHVALTER